MKLEIPEGVVCVSDSVLSGIDRSQVDEIIFASTVREVEPFVFKNLLNLKSIAMNDGLENVGTCAFRGCTALKSIEFPGSVVNIAGGAFRDCSELASISFRSGGLARMTIADNAFAAVGDEASIRRACRSENELRNANRLRKVFADVSQTEYFVSYLRSYQDAVSRYRIGANWADEELLTELFYSRINPVSNLMQGGISQGVWASFERRIAVGICEVLSNAAGAGVSEVVKSCRRQFDEEVLRCGDNEQHRVLFNRVVVSLLPGRDLVQVIDCGKLRAAVGLLSANGYVPTYEISAVEDDWYSLSHLMFNALSSAVPGKSPYEIGVFGWCIADSFRQDGGHVDEATRQMRSVMRTSLQAVGLI